MLWLHSYVQLVTNAWLSVEAWTRFNEALLLFIELYCFQLYCPILSTKIILNTFDTFVKGKTHLLIFQTWGFLLSWPARCVAAAFPILGSSHQWGWMCNPSVHIGYEHSSFFRSAQTGNHTFTNICRNRGSKISHGLQWHWWSHPVLSCPSGQALSLSPLCIPLLLHFSELALPPSALSLPLSLCK